MTTDPNVADPVKLAAIKDALDRSGIQAKTAVTVEVSTKPFERVFDRIAAGPREPALATERDSLGDGTDKTVSESDDDEVVVGEFDDDPLPEGEIEPDPFRIPSVIDVEVVADEYSDAAMGDDPDPTTPDDLDSSASGPYSPIPLGPNYPGGGMLSLQDAVEAAADMRARQAALRCFPGDGQGGVEGLCAGIGVGADLTDLLGMLRAEIFPGRHVLPRAPARGVGARARPPGAHGRPTRSRPAGLLAPRERRCARRRPPSARRSAQLATIRPPVGELQRPRVRVAVCSAAMRAAKGVAWRARQYVGASLCEMCLVTRRLATVLSTMCRCTGNPSPTVMRSSRSHERTRRRCTPPRQPSRRHVLAEAASRRLQRRLLPNRPPSALQGHH